MTTTLESIDSSIIEGINVYVYFNTQEEINKFGYERDWLNYRIVNNYRVPNFWNNHIKNMDADIIVFANDDIYIFKNTLIKIKEIFNSKFTDFDGVIGLNQINIDSLTKLNSAFCAVGAKFADRFQDRKVICPDYYRFYGDRELGLFANSIKKFHYDETIGILHFHPCTNLTLIDSTHKEVRKYLKKDEEIFYKRQSLGWLWGRDSNLLNE